MATSQQKFQVSELSGMMLDFACAQFDPHCEGTRWEFRDDHYVGYGHDEGSTDEYVTTLICDPDDWKYRIVLCVRYGLQQVLVYSPSTMWARGGAIIEQERISTIDLKKLRSSPYWFAAIKFDIDGYHDGVTGEFEGFGETPLIAAMRCYVAGKAGSTIDLGGAV